MGSIVTFYSFKGGVGRTMALANIAALLCKRGLRVLAVDWDMEAPGLDKYFRDYRLRDSNAGGLLEMLVAANAKSPKPDWRDYVTTLDLNGDHLLNLILSRPGAEGYSRQLSDFSWDEFFEENEGGDFIESLRQDWYKDYDVTLIDSRTGLTDSGGVCTIQLPDVLVAVFTANHQSFYGVKDVIERAKAGRRRIAYGRMPLTVLPILSRWDGNVEFEESQRWLDLIAEELIDCYADWLPTSENRDKGVRRVDEVRRTLEWTKIPHIAYFSFGEKLPAITHGTSDPEGMGFVYNILADIIRSDFKKLGPMLETSDEATTAPTEREGFVWDVFVSYSKADEDVAIDLAERLRSDGLKVWFDNWNIKPGQSLTRAIEDGLKKSRKLVLMMSEAQSESAWVRAETEAVEFRDPSNKAQSLLPVLIDDTEIPLPLRVYSYIDWRTRDEDEYRRLLAAIKLSEVEDTGKDTKSRAVHNLPFRRNPHFTGRMELLEQLETSLMSFGSSDLAHPVVISGLGGIGKTQVAIEYAHRHIEDYTAIFWINAESESSITASYTEIARLLSLPEADAQETSVVTTAVIRWLTNYSDWLAIYDNAEDPNLVSEYLPKTYSGHIVLTSRSPSFGKIADTMNLSALEHDQATALLLSRAGIDSPDERQLETVADICNILGYLPLAIDQAGAFLEQTGASLSEYKLILDTKGIVLLENARYSSGTYDQTVATTWLASMEHVREANPGAEDILKLASYLAPDDIPIDLIRSGEEFFTGVLAKTVGDELDLMNAIAALQDYSLIDRPRGGDGFSVNRLLMAVVRNWLDDEEKVKWTNLGIGCCNAMFPDPSDFGNWPLCQRLYPHLLQCVSHARELNMSSESFVILLYNAASYSKARADFDASERLFISLLDIHEQAIDSDPRISGSVYNNLADMYREQGRFQESESLVGRTLEIYESSFGRNHPLVASALTNQALTYMETQRLQEAEPLLTQALEILEITYGPDHPNVGTALNNLATLFRLQDRVYEAKQSAERSLNISEKAYGADHPSVASSLNNLASLNSQIGHFDLAMSLYGRSLRITESKFGSEHPETAKVLYDYGVVLYVTGSHSEAAEMMKRSYSIFFNVLGADHSRTSAAREQLLEWGESSVDV